MEYSISERSDLSFYKAARSSSPRHSPKSFTVFEIGLSGTTSTSLVTLSTPVIQIHKACIVVNSNKAQIRQRTMDGSLPFFRIYSFTPSYFERKQAYRACYLQATAFDLPFPPAIRSELLDFNFRVIQCCNVISLHPWIVVVAKEK